MFINDFWLVVDLPLWKMMEFVSWEYDIPNMMGKSVIKFHGSSHHQAVRYNIVVMLNHIPILLWFFYGFSVTHNW
jgi:hypothetical protein